MTQRNLTCIVCPLGCDLKVTLEGKNVVRVEGNTCPRGKVYAENECTNPVRTITTTVRCDDGGVVSVKTNKPVPKDKIFECMGIINSSKISLPVSIGSVIIENIADTGSDIVITQNRM